MKEIKFRAWDEENKRMRGPFEVGSKLSMEWDPEMQYTGLKDKNGKEIYEGDIVKESDVIGHIEYYHNRFLVMMKGGSVFTPGVRCEVIGNIYENLDLLNT